jgi:tight adherence protein C
MSEMMPLYIALIVFASVAGLVYVVGLYVNSQAAVERRLGISRSTPESAILSENPPSYFIGSLTNKIDEKQFGIEGALRTKLRRNLIRAGYFSDRAIRNYIFMRLALVLIIPTLIFIIDNIIGVGQYQTLASVGVSALVAIGAVDAYIARRSRILQQEYRIVFPDLIDMLVVCVDAGLSLDGAFGRIRPEVSKQNRALGMNLTLLSAETRAGRSLPDALNMFADRLNLDEARAFVIMIRQSLELGTDVGEALRVFSDEMRQKRLLRAEETANKLPVKMVLPLGLCIFPVILMVVMVPVIIKFVYIARTMG